MHRKDVLVLLPAFNEEQNITQFLGKLILANILDFADVLIVNDGSSDNTEQIVSNEGFNVISHIYNLGYGCALQTGYKYAVRNNYRYVVQIDSDGQHDVCNIHNIINTLKSESPPDIVIGSRFLKDSAPYNMSWIRKCAITLFRAMIKGSTKQFISDPTSGLQGLNRRAFTFYSHYNHFVHSYPDANMVIQMLLNNFKFKEIPAVMHPRLNGESMHSGLKPIIYMLQMLLTTTIVIIRESTKKQKT